VARERIVGVLRLASWNVLAPSYAHQSRYAGVSPDDLAAAARVPRVRARILGLLADRDVVALQEADADLVAWLRAEAGASVAHAPRPSSSDGVLLASTTHELAGSTGVTSDGRRTWASAAVGDVLLVSVHLDPEIPQRRLHGLAQARELVAWCDAQPAAAIAVLGDINGAWAGRTGEVLRRAGFETAPCGATAATNGRTRELDVIAVRGCAALAVSPTGLPPVGTALWLPGADVPSDHAPLLATVG
jgi:endonuclease/exonuclease/phosphatase family metal-dependent hydrolase